MRKGTKIFVLTRHHVICAKCGAELDVNGNEYSRKEVLGAAEALGWSYGFFDRTLNGITTHEDGNLCPECNGTNKRWRDFTEEGGGFGGHVNKVLLTVRPPRHLRQSWG